MQALPASDRDKLADRIVLGAAAALLACASIGFALSATLVVHEPLWLLALAPWPRHMILVAPNVDFVSFMVIATLRAYASCVVGYAIGARFGAARVAMYQQRSKHAAKLYTIFMDVFERAGHAMILFIPGPMSAGLAAISGIRARVALPILFIGQAAWVYVNFRLGHALQAWTLPIIAFVRMYMWQATLGCTLAAAIYEWNRRRRARNEVSDAPVTESERS